MVQRRNSAQNYYYFSLVLVGVLLSTISRRIEPLCAILPLIVALAYSRLVRLDPAVHVGCTITPTRAFEGDCLTIRTTLKAETFVPPMEFWHPLPPEAVYVQGESRLLFTLRPGEERVVEQQVRIDRRGLYTLGRFYSRVHPDTGLCPLLAEYRQDQVCRIYPQVTPLPHLMPPWRTHASSGNYVSQTAGDGVEFAGIRPYHTGDRIRRIHWRTSVKRRTLYVNEYYHEYNADVVILLDTLASVGNPHGTNTLDTAVRAAASLASHYLKQKDRVGLVNYGGVCTWVLPSSGQQQLYRILDALLVTRVHFSYLPKDIGLIPPRVLPPRALIFVITTLIDRRIEAALHDLVARAFQLILLVISPTHVMPGPASHVEGAARLWRLETAQYLHEFRRLGIPIIIQAAANPLDDLQGMLSRGTIWQQIRQGSSFG